MGFLVLLEFTPLGFETNQMNKGVNLKTTLEFTPLGFETCIVFFKKLL